MKKILITFMLCSFFGGIAMAQCSHAKKTEAKNSCHSEKVSAQAIKAAEMNDAIDKKTCEKSGKVSFVRRTVDQKTGEEHIVMVVYNEEKGAFESLERTGDFKGKKGCCAAKADKKSCCAKKMKGSSESEQSSPAEGSNRSKI